MGPAVLSVGVGAWTAPAAVVHVRAVSAMQLPWQVGGGPPSVHEFASLAPLGAGLGGAVSVPASAHRTPAPLVLVHAVSTVLHARHTHVDKHTLTH